MIRRTGALTCALVLAAGIAVSSPATAAAPARPRVSPPAAATPTTPSAWVTLITGDRVRVADGRAVQIEPARRARPVPFLRFAVGKDSYVVPGDAGPLVTSGALDRQLFNVTGLVRQGYADDRSAVIPLLAEYRDARSVAAAAAPVGSAKVRTLKSMNFTVLTARKAEAPRFWSAVKPATGGRSLVASLSGARLWLDGKATALLDQSVPQIGAPTAWLAGYTGKGVTVAVLDSGYDTDHADLAGRVATSADFTDSGSVEDKAGHGTHVASIALGSGAASGGRYRGVAPGANLAVGKVLDDQGSGQFSWILAGMEWAATTAHAKVVNMSLGGGSTDGTDPLSQGVDTLSRAHGTLFVIAAGNSGEDDRVSSPAAASEALAVASVTKSDGLSDFSSRGPRLGDNAIKPELAAPGSDIVAARATGTSPDAAIDDNYVSHSGTSMASPHVAGAAAILAQQHPDWDGPRLKAALMSTAKPLTGLGPNAVGAGRLDLVRATTQAVQASTASVNERVKWPVTPSQQQTVTYSNSSSAPVTLALDLALTNSSGKPAPDGLVRLSAGTVTVPAGGPAGVVVTMTAQDGLAGAFAGVLTATSADGAVVVRTPVSAYQEPESYDLTVKLKNRAGAVPAPDLAYAQVFDLATGEWVNQPGEQQPLPPGRYAVLSVVVDERPGQEPVFSIVDQPELKLTKDTTVTLDARTARRVSMKVDQPAAHGGQHTAGSHLAIPGVNLPIGLSIDTDPMFHEVYAASVKGVRSDNYFFDNWLHAEDPSIELAATAPEAFGVPAQWFGTSPEPDLEGAFGVVNAGRARLEDLAKVDAAGKLVLFGLTSAESDFNTFIERIHNIEAAGGKVAVHRFAAGVPAGLARSKATLKPDGDYALPLLQAAGPSADRLFTAAAAGPVTVRLATRKLQKHRYEIVASERGAIPARALRYHPKTKDLAKARTRYYGSLAGYRHAQASVQLGSRTFVQPLSAPVQVQSERVEYFTPGVWTMKIDGGAEDWEELVGAPQELKAGVNRALEWNKAAFGPQFTGVRSDWRGSEPWVSVHEDGLLKIGVPLSSDAAGHARVLNFFDEGTTSLYRGEDETCCTVAGAGSAQWNIGEGGDHFRLKVRNVRNQAWWPLATTSEAEWSFAARPQPGKTVVLPLLTVAYDPNVDLRNTAPGGQTVTFPLIVARQAGAGSPTVSSLTVDVSYDDGKTWTAAKVKQVSGQWKLTVKHPAAGFVSLRAKAADTDGNTVQQTVIRAYQLR